MEFILEHTDAGTGARAGRIETDHGTILTPVFMPVGTVGSVKGVSPRELKSDINAQITLGNTYHLYLRPGVDILKQAGGLHRFQNWDRPILTDSGGYQVFSLSGIRKLTEEGVRFQSHLNGSYHMFSPEAVMDIQRAIGADIMMVLDECPPGDSSHRYADESNDLTIRWARRCRDHFDANPALYDYSQALFGIVQGVVYPDLRKKSAEQLLEIGFPGYAIGGLSVGEPSEQMYDMVEVVNQVLPTDKPRYLMGVGTPENLIENVARGVDMFDCVMPTRNGRNASVFTTRGIANMKNAKWKDAFEPMDPGLDAYHSNAFTKAYVRHLIIAGEILGIRITTMQNLALYHWVMQSAREAILEDRYGEWMQSVLPDLTARL